MMCSKVIYTGLIKTKIGNWNSDGYFHFQRLSIRPFGRGAKSEEILKSVHNRNFNRYMNQHVTVIILVY